MVLYIAHQRVGRAHVPLHRGGHIPGGGEFLQPRDTGFAREGRFGGGYTVFQGAAHGFQFLLLQQELPLAFPQELREGVWLPVCHIGVDLL